MNQDILNKIALSLDTPSRFALSLCCKDYRKYHTKPNLTAAVFMKNFNLFDFIIEYCRIPIEEAMKYIIKSNNKKIIREYAVNYVCHIHKLDRMHHDILLCIETKPERIGIYICDKGLTKVSILVGKIDDDVIIQERLKLIGSNGIKTDSM